MRMRMKNEKTLRLQIVLLVVYMFARTGAIFPELANEVTTSESAECTHHSEIYMKSLKNYTLWAYQMLDASARSHVGHLAGQVFQLGDFNECLQIQGPFATQYCLVNLTINLTPEAPTSISNPYESVFSRLARGKGAHAYTHSLCTSRVGLCIPASCSPNDLKTSLENYLKNENHFERINFIVQVSELFCQNSIYEKPVETWDILFCATTAVAVTLVVVCSILKHTCWNINDFDQLTMDENSITMASLFNAFCVQTNYRNLCQLSIGAKYTASLNGFRTISTCAVIILNRLWLTMGSPLTDFEDVEGYFRKPLSSFFLHGDLLVDSFFVFGGTLVAFNWSSKSPNPFILVLMRYVRLTPMYAYIIMFYASVFYYLGSGPIWKSFIFNGETKDCRDNWWTNILYINNIVNVDHICMVHSWYLSCDFHFFIISVFVLWILQKNQKIGLWIMIAMLLISIVIPFTLSVVNQEAALLYLFNMFTTSYKDYPYFKNSYVKSYNRATPYVIGLFTGYMYWKHKERCSHLSQLSCYLIFLVSSLLLTCTILSGCFFYDVNYKYNPLEASAYSALHRIPWSLGVSGLLIATNQVKCGALYRALTSKIWVAPARLSFGAYLVHAIFPTRESASVKISTQFDPFKLFCSALGDIVLSFSIAFLIYLLIEMPVKNLSKIYFDKMRKVSKIGKDLMLVKFKKNQR